MKPFEYRGITVIPYTNGDWIVLDGHTNPTFALVSECKEHIDKLSN